MINSIKFFQNKLKLIAPALICLNLFTAPVCSTKITIKNNENKKNLRVSDKFKSNNWEDRLSAIKNLSKYIQSSDDLKHVIDLYIEATYDPHLSIKIESIKKLTKYPSKKAFNRIIEIASDKKDINLRWYSLMALSRYRDIKALPVFEKGLKNKDWLIREASINGILMIDTSVETKKIITLIIKSLNDPSNSVKITTLKNVKIKDKKIYNKIVKIFNSQMKKKNSLFKASLKALIGYKLDNKTREKLIALLSDINRNIRIGALRILKAEKTKL